MDSKKKIESPSRFGFIKLIVIIIVCFFIVFLLLEMMVRSIVLIAKYPISGMGDVDAKKQMADEYINVPLNNMILVTGASSSNQDIYPELIDQKLQEHGIEGHIINFAHSGGLPETNLYILNDMLKSGSKPKLIIYDFTPPWIFNKTYLDTYSIITTFHNSFAYNCLYKKPENLLKKLQCEVTDRIFLIKYRPYLKSFIQTSAANIFSPKIKYYTSSLIGSYSPKGWTPLYLHNTKENFNGVNSVTGPQSEMLKYLYGNFEWSDEQMDLLTNFAQKNEIPLLLIWMPEHPIKKDYYEYFDVSEKKFTDKFVYYKTLPYIQTLDLHEMPMQDNDFADYGHLNPSGAVSISNYLSDYLIKNVLNK